MADVTCPIDGCSKPLKKRGRWCSAHEARYYRYGSPTGKPTPKTLAERVFAKVEKTETCWLWTGWCDSYGYGILRVGGRPKKAHRLVWELSGRTLTDGLVLDHTCYNTRCVRPDHLREVSRKQNVENFSKPLRRSNTSGFRGASFHKASGYWVGHVRHDGTDYRKYFKSREEAGEWARMTRLRLMTHNDLDRKSA